MTNALQIHPADNVVVLTAPVRQGDPICYAGGGREVRLIAAEPIPIYHKAAICEIAAGGQIVKYAHSIGTTLTGICVGEHVHCHNMESPKKETL